MEDDIDLMGLRPGLGVVSGGDVKPHVSTIN